MVLDLARLGDRITTDIMAPLESSVLTKTSVPPDRTRHEIADHLPPSHRAGTGAIALLTNEAHHHQLSIVVEDRPLFDPARSSEELRAQSQDLVLDQVRYRTVVCSRLLVDCLRTLDPRQLLLEFASHLQRWTIVPVLPRHQP